MKAYAINPPTATIIVRAERKTASAMRSRRWPRAAEVGAERQIGQEARAQEKRGVDGKEIIGDAVDVL